MEKINSISIELALTAIKDIKDNKYTLEVFEQFLNILKQTNKPI